MENEKNELSLHFIVGIGRSGTTLISTILNSHPHIKATPEANFLQFFLHKYQSKPILLVDLELILNQINTYRYSHPWVGWSFDQTAVRKYYQDIVNTYGSVSYKQLCRIIYSGFQELNKSNAKTEVIIDKNPSYSLYLNQLHAFNKVSKFILTYRDYRANVLSRKQSVYLKSSNVAFNAYRWRLFNKKLKTFAKNHAAICYELKYEDLVTKKDAVLQELFDFLGQNKQLCESNTTVTNVALETDFEIPAAFKERFDKKYNDLSQSVNQNRVASWEQQLSAKEIEICDIFCGSIGTTLGYTPKKDYGLLKKFYYHCAYIVPITKAVIDVKKDAILHYINPAIKLKRLKKSYINSGLITGKK